MSRRTFLIESRTENLEPLRKDLAQALGGPGLSEKELYGILVSVVEACTNSIRHAYGNAPDGKIHITVDDRKDRVILKIRDYGKKIDLAKIPSPTLPPVNPGGLGIYFMKTFTDELKYNTRHARGTELTLVKYKNRSPNKEEP
ncbi:MAG TPA: ATP-binding protein [Candidatus Omnitrophota bacterium]|nr:ATP-binding protein [Candidatus Omnitrophota bacterium]